MIHKVFSDTIGQENVKVRMTQSVLSGINGGEMLSPLFVQEAGGGKSHFMRRTEQAFKQAGFKTLYFNSPEEFREEGSNYDSLLELITGEDKFAIGIDEFHKFHKRPTVRMEKVFNFLMKALDKGNEGRPIRFDTDTVTTFSRNKGCFIMGTNFPHSLDKSGAFQSRCDLIKLDPYTVEELVQILQVMLVGADFQEANENTLRMIARCGRGTARPMERIVGQIKLARSAEGGKRKTINREDVLSALKLCKMYPKGLTPNEIKILKTCGRPMRDVAVLAANPDLEKQAYSRSKGYLISEGLGAQIGAGFQITKLGEEYLKAAQKEGFII